MNCFSSHIWLRLEIMQHLLMPRVVSGSCKTWSISWQDSVKNQALVSLHLVSKIPGPVLRTDRNVTRIIYQAKFGSHKYSTLAIDVLSLLSIIPTQTPLFNSGPNSLLATSRGEEIVAKIVRDWAAPHPRTQLCSSRLLLTKGSIKYGVRRTGPSTNL